MNIIDTIKSQIIKLINLPDEKIVLDVPKNREFGDYSTNIAMKLAKSVGKNPREFAQKLIAQMNFETTYITRAEVAGAGFINFFLDDRWLAEVPKNVRELGANYGANNSLSGQSICLEYVSANPTGPMHMGNARGGALGDSLARIMRACGADTTREFYLNDAGNQIVKLGKSLYSRYMQAQGIDYAFPEDGYHGSDIIRLAEEFGVTDGSEEEVTEKLITFALERNCANMKRVLGEYRVEYDVWFKESELYENNDVEKIVDMLEKNGATYEKDGAIWLKCDETTDEKDEVLVRANGIPTYFAADIAYHYNKLHERKFDRAINVWGADHHGHIARMKRSMELLGIDGNRLEVITIQLVRLMRGGEIARMSKRSGEMITLEDLLEEIGIDAARYFFNMRLANSHFDFDLELAVRKSSDNPVYYVQYAHARICSILENAPEWSELQIECFSPTYEHETEKNLLRKIAQFPNEMAICAQTLEPSRLTHYATDLAGEFHSFYGTCKVITDNENVRNSRLLLADVTRQTLANVLDMLGVSAPERM